jgi:hypothetical protein
MSTIIRQILGDKCWKIQSPLALSVMMLQISLIYDGESNENRKTEIKIRNIAPLSYKLADMLPML